MTPAPIAPTIRDALDRFGDAVRGKFGARVREIVLFGSQARGEAQEDSDVDILVVVDGLSDDERRLVFDLAYDAGAAGEELIVISPLPYSTVQVTDMRRRERRLMSEIAREGVAL